MKTKLALLAIAVSTSACVQRMGVHGHLRPFDGATPLHALRAPPEGTVFQDAPEPVSRKLTPALLERGHTAFDIHCLPCHGPGGYGNGIVVQRGFLAPPSYHIDRLREVQDRHFFDVITDGYGAMYSYADRVSVQDRWAIVAYIRALQLSQNAPIASLMAADKAKLEEASGP